MLKVLGCGVFLAALSAFTTAPASAALVSPSSSDRILKVQALCPESYGTLRPLASPLIRVGVVLALASFPSLRRSPHVPTSDPVVVMGIGPLAKFNRKRNSEDEPGNELPLATSPSLKTTNTLRAAVLHQLKRTDLTDRRMALHEVNLLNRVNERLLNDTDVRLSDLFSAIAILKRLKGSSSQTLDAEKLRPAQPREGALTKIQAAEWLSAYRTYLRTQFADYSKTAPAYRLPLVHFLMEDPRSVSFIALLSERQRTYAALAHLPTRDVAQSLSIRPGVAGKALREMMSTYLRTLGDLGLELPTFKDEDFHTSPATARAYAIPPFLSQFHAQPKSTRPPSGLSSLEAHQWLAEYRKRLSTLTLEIPFARPRALVDYLLHSSRAVDYIETTSLAERDHLMFLHLSREGSSESTKKRMTLLIQSFTAWIESHDPSVIIPRRAPRKTAQTAQPLQTSA